jgi:hypothetical protein
LTIPHQNPRLNITSVNPRNQVSDSMPTTPKTGRKGGYRIAENDVWV